MFSQHSAPCKVTADLATEMSHFWSHAVITFVKWKVFFFFGGGGLLIVFGYTIFQIYGI